jgi:RES domain-containing protein
MIVETAYNGTLFRCVRHSTTEPLTGRFAADGGGRWNPPSSFPVLYTFTAQNLARTWVAATWADVSVTLDELQPELQPDLLILEVAVDPVADLASDAGLMAGGLPATYPEGFETRASWGVTRPVGVRIHDQRLWGLITRSASATSWTVPLVNWGEVAIFTEFAPEPKLVDRIPYPDWF